MASIFFKFPNKQDFELVINQLGDLQDTTPVMARISSLLKRYIRKNFEEEGRPANWVPLNPIYKRQKEEERGVANILKTTGRLARSVQPGYGRDYAKVSTNLVYARIHHNGGIIRAKKKKALAFGGVTRKRVIIPARPFMTITDEDRKGIIIEIQNFVAKKLGLQRR
jgi:phage virion morphogenesis protein